MPKAKAAGNERAAAGEDFADASDESGRKYALRTARKATKRYYEEFEETPAEETPSKTAKRAEKPAAETPSKTAKRARQTSEDLLKVDQLVADSIDFVVEKLVEEAKAVVRAPSKQPIAANDSEHSKASSGAAAVAKPTPNRPAPVRKSQPVPRDPAHSGSPVHKPFTRVPGPLKSYLDGPFGPARGANPSFGGKAFQGHSALSERPETPESGESDISRDSDSDSYDSDEELNSMAADGTMRWIAQPPTPKKDGGPKGRAGVANMPLDGAPGNSGRLPAAEPSSPFGFAIKGMRVAVVRPGPKGETKLGEIENFFPGKRIYQIRYMDHRVEYIVESQVKISQGTAIEKETEGDDAEDEPDEAQGEPIVVMEMLPPRALPPPAGPAPQKQPMVRPPVPGKPPPPRATFGGAPQATARFSPAPILNKPKPGPRSVRQNGIDQRELEPGEMIDSSTGHVEHAYGPSCVLPLAKAPPKSTLLNDREMVYSPSEFLADSPVPPGREAPRLPPGTEDALAIAQRILAGKSATPPPASSQPRAAASHSPDYLLGDLSKGFKCMLCDKKVCGKKPKMVVIEIPACEDCATDKAVTVDFDDDQPDAGESQDPLKGAAADKSTGECSSTVDAE